MKILLFTALAILTIYSVSAQGVFNANNYPIYEYYRALIWVTDRPPPLAGEYLLSKEVGRVEIIDARDQTTLSPGGSAGVPLVLDGIFFINGLVVPGVPVGGSANVIVRAWDITTGATFQDAYRKGMALVSIEPLGDARSPATFLDNSNFNALVIRGSPPSTIPEPSPIALAALGLGGLFVCCKRR